MTDRLGILTETVNALAQAAAQLGATHATLAGWFPLTAESLRGMDQAEQERLDAYAIRYARCQDLLYPAMRALARAQLEPKADAGFLPLFALMQKQGITTSLDDWERQRGLRNAVGHAYPDAGAVTDILNGIRTAAPEIVELTARLRAAAIALGLPEG